MKDVGRNEINIGDEVWFTVNNSLNFYEGKVVSLDEDFGKVVIKDKPNNTYERIFWSVLKRQNTTTQESNNQISKKIRISLWNSKDDSIVKSFDLDEFDEIDELRIKL